MKKGNWPGTWKVVCDVCGFWYRSDEVKERWDGLIVCAHDYETRHPMDFLKTRAEKITPDFVRRPPPDEFVSVTYFNTGTGLHFNYQPQ